MPVPHHLPHPWRYLGEHWPEVVVAHDLTRPWPRAITDWSAPVPRIRMYRGMEQVERRCAATHERFHLELGPAVRGHSGWVERRVVDLTARWLLPDLDVMRRTLAGGGLHSAADELWVTFTVLVDRLNGPQRS